MANSKKLIPEAPSSAPRVDHTRELIARLASKSFDSSESEIKSIAEALGMSAEEVRQEKERMAVEARLERIETALERLATTQPQRQSNFQTLLAFIQKPGPGLEVLLQCLGASLILGTIGLTVLFILKMVMHR